MKNKYHIYFDNKCVKEFVKNGFKTDSDLSGIIVDIYDDDIKWPFIAEMIERYKPVINICTSFFTKEELLASTWIRIDSNINSGYPEPSGHSIDYKRESFDLSNYCNECCIGAVQISPFRTNIKPKLQNKIITLNWVPHSFITSHEIWESIFKDSGIDYFHVINHRTGKEIDDIVQLRMEMNDACSIDTTELPFVICKKCKRKKFNYFLKGIFPNIKPVSSEIEVFYSQEFFGDGGLAYHETFISNKICEKLLSSKIKGLNFTPVELTFKGQIT